MTDWATLARNHIAGRDWNTICNVWEAAARGYDPNNTLDLADSAAAMVTPDFIGAHSQVFSGTGLDVAAFHDVMATVTKASYVLRSVCSSVLSGQPTWASVDAYHFSFIACRSLLALLGIHIVTINGAGCLVDIFPTGVIDQVAKRFNRQHKGIANPVSICWRARDPKIDQGAYWAILDRALNVTSHLPQNVLRDTEVIGKLGQRFGRSRNEMLYRDQSWLYSEDKAEPSLSSVFNDDIHNYPDLEEFFVSQRDANFAFAALFARVLLNLTNAIANPSGVDLLPSSYGKTLKQFSTFNVPDLSAVFSSLYAKDGYCSSL